MSGGCYVFYFYIYFAPRSKIFSENVRKPINKTIKGLTMTWYSMPICNDLLGLI